MEAPRAGRRIRLASFNIQAGIDTVAWRQYLTRSWRHVLPDGQRAENLARIGEMLRAFDLVGLQEVDGGSLRSGFVDQTRSLAQHGRFDYWYRQSNRRIGKLSQHGNALLARFRPAAITEHPLPGLRGRGALVVRFGCGEQALHVCVVHLALSVRARLRQAVFLGRLLAPHRHVVLMGDFNCTAESEEFDVLASLAGLQDAPIRLNTFPSWAPRQNIDHILVSPGLTVENARVLDFPLSDHLPVSMDLKLPRELALVA